MGKKKDKTTSLRDVIRYELSNIINFWNKLVRPSKEQLKMSLKLQALGIGLVGVVGYVIKLIHIPINNILVSKPN